MTWVLAIESSIWSVRTSKVGTYGKDYVHTIDEIHKKQPWIPFLRLASILIACTDVNRNVLINSRSPPADPSLLEES